MAKKKRQNVKIKKKVIKNSDRVSTVMKQFESGELKDKSGNIITDRRQAIAKALQSAGINEKNLRKTEIINKIKVMKNQVVKQLEKESAQEDVIFNNVISFFQENRNPTDEQIHQLAEKNNIDPSQIEKIIYSIVSDLLHGGKSKGISKKYDPEEIRLGMIVEAEHSSIPAIQRKITLDHLAEDPKYYSKGKAKGLFPELSDISKVCDKDKKKVDKAWQRKDGTWWERDDAGNIVPAKQKGKESRGSRKPTQNEVYNHVMNKYGNKSPKKGEIKEIIESLRKNPDSTLEAESKKVMEDKKRTLPKWETEKHPWE